MLVLDDHASALLRVTADGIDSVRFGEGYDDEAVEETDGVTMFEPAPGSDDSWFLDLFADREVKRDWHASGGYRGYYETWPHLTGLDRIASGWATGDWDDVPHKKAWHVFTGLLEAAPPPVEVFVVLEPTSNVFSTAVDVAVREGDREAFAAWLEEHGLSVDTLKGALG